MRQVVAQPALHDEVRPVPSKTLELETDVGWSEIVKVHSARLSVHFDHRIITIVLIMANDAAVPLPAIRIGYALGLREQA
jgi:hypothetical protein